VGSGRGDLGAAIQTLGDRIGERFGVQVACELDFAEPLRLSETAAAHVYRIVQEALTNVVRHSDAREVTIRLRTSDNELHLQVDDDGKGIAMTPMDRADGLGLKIMRYRAQMLGGDLVIESTETGGTSVRCSCPLDLTVEVDRGNDPA
jgi:signal transduction histidine kinase